MALNVLISNRDDHIFNQAMILQRYFTHPQGQQPRVDTPLACPPDYSMYAFQQKILQQNHAPDTIGFVVIAHIGGDQRGILLVQGNRVVECIK